MKAMLFALIVAGAVMHAAAALQVACEWQLHDVTL